MNADRNGKQNTEPAQSAELTAFALGQLDEMESSRIQERIAGDVDAQTTVTEIRRVANLIEQTADHDLPVGISGLEERMGETLNQQAHESEVSPRARQDPERTPRFWEVRRVFTVVATLLLAAGGAYWLLRAEMPREVATNYADSSNSIYTYSADDGDEILPGVDVMADNEEDDKLRLGRGFSVGAVEKESLSRETPGKGNDRDLERLQTPETGDSIDNLNSEEIQKLVTDPGGLTDDVANSSSSRRITFSGKDDDVFDDGSKVIVDESKPQGGRVVNQPDYGNLDIDGVNITLPKMATTTETSAVTVPDGGTVILGGIKLEVGEDRESAGRTEFEVTREAIDRRSQSQTLTEFSQQLMERQTREVRNQPLAVVDGPGDPRVLALEGVIRNGFENRRFELDVDHQPNNEQYELPPENRFLQPVGATALSTFSIDVDTASYSNLRRFVTSGQLPPPPSVRVEELVNYFSYDYKQPADDQAFAVDMEVAGCPWDPSHRLMRIGIKGKEVARDDRPPSNLVFLIDVSGSMSDSSKLPLLQRSMLLLVDRLTENDRVTIVTYTGNAGLRLPPTSGDQKQKIRDVISGLASGGSTHGSAGIQMAYNLASEHFIDEGVNRVILATDGDLNVGVTADDQLVSLIKDKARLGIFLSVLGFGTGNLKDAKLEKIANNGNGQYSYIDSIQEARKVLVDEMAGSLITIAKDVKIQIEFNPAEIAAYRLIGYENRALKNEDFDNDGVDAGDIGAGHTVTAFYELIPTGVAQPRSTIQPAEPLRYQQAVQVEVVDEIRPKTNYELTDAARTGELLTLSLRHKEPQADESSRTHYVVYDDDKVFDEASTDFRFAASVASFGMLLRQSQYAGNWNLSHVEQQAAAAAGEDSKGHRSEFVDLVRQVRKLAGH